MIKISLPVARCCYRELLDEIKASMGDADVSFELSFHKYKAQSHHSTACEIQQQEAGKQVKAKARIKSESEVDQKF